MSGWDVKLKTKPPVRFGPRIQVIIGAEEPSSEAPLAEQIRAYRRVHGLTQAQFGALFGVSPATVSDWELGRSRPSVLDLKQDSYFYPLAIP